MMLWFGKKFDHIIINDDHASQCVIDVDGGVPSINERDIKDGTTLVCAFLNAITIFAKFVLKKLHSKSLQPKRLIISCRMKKVAVIIHQICSRYVLSATRLKALLMQANSHACILRLMRMAIQSHHIIGNEMRGAFSTKS